MSSSQAIFDRIRGEFISDLDDRIQSIRLLWQTQLHEGGSAPGYQELARLLHNLAGAASTFKIERLHDVARRLENILLTLSTEQCFEMKHDTQEQIDSLISHLSSFRL